MKAPVLLLIRLVVSCGFLLLPVIPLFAAGETPGTPPTGWMEWAEWAEKLRPVTDKEGHGPDVGSSEWMAAVDRQLKITDPSGHGPQPGSEAWRQAVEKKLAPKAPAESRELLSSHEVIARFTGLKDHVCMGRTALCPDRCGDSGKLATFTVVKYVHFHKPGEYGDPKQEQFLVLIEDNMKNPKVPAGIRDVILALKPGDLVDLRWTHDYVTRDGSKFPERPILKISYLTKEQAEKTGDNAR